MNNTLHDAVLAVNIPLAVTLSYTAMSPVWCEPALLSAKGIVSLLPASLLRYLFKFNHSKTQQTQIQLH